MRTYLLREESSRCKLTDDQIESIIRIRSEWMTYDKISKLFKVSYMAVWLHCNPERKHEYNKKQWEKRDKEWYYKKKEVRKKMMDASAKTGKKKMDIIPWYKEYIYLQRTNRATDKKYESENE